MNSSPEARSPLLWVHLDELVIGVENDQRVRLSHVERMRIAINAESTGQAGGLRNA